MWPKSVCFLHFLFNFLLILCVNLSGGGNVPKEWADQQIYDSRRCGLFLELEKTDGEKGSQNGGEKMNILNRIMGGQNVREGTSPWTAAIFRQKADKAVYICSGTLISKRHVITAAHCMFGESANKLCFREVFKSATRARAEEMCRQPNGFLTVQQILQQISVYLGSICLSGHNNPPCVSPKVQRKFRVKNALESAFCGKKCASDDFIVLELDVDDQPGSAVPASLANHVCLHFMHNLQDDFYWRETLNGTDKKAVQVAGWGTAPGKQKNSQYGKAYPWLQKLEMPSIWPHEQCVQKKAQWDDGLGFSEDKLCTTEQQNQDSCLGDSGGGLVGFFEDGKGRERWFLFGVLSSGADCRQLHYGSVQPLIQEFTNVTFHKNSIEKFVRSEMNSNPKTTEETKATTKRKKKGKNVEKEDDGIGQMWGDCQ